MCMCVVMEMISGLEIDRWVFRKTHTEYICLLSKMFLG